MPSVRALHVKLLPLRDEIEIVPGRQAGSACGVGLSGKPSSTLGFDKRCDSLLSKGSDEFIVAVSQVLLSPTEMDRMMRVNHGLAA
jgi:hypothetical protein